MPVPSALVNGPAATAICLGAMAGAGARWGVVELVGDGDWPWGLLAANTVGSAVLGWLLAGDWRGDVSRLLRPAVGIGFCGSLTTMSGVAVALAELGRDARWGLGAAYLTTSLAAAAAGVVAGARTRGPAAT